MRRFLLSALAAGVFFAQPAIAAPAYDPQALRTSVSLDDLRAIVGLMGGHKVEEEHVWGDGGAEDISLRGVDADGLKYLLVGTACSTVSCKGVMMQVRYEADAVEYEQLAKAGLERASISLWFDKGDKTLGVTRYVILDYGITMRNLRENLVVLLDLAGDAANAALGDEEDAPAADAPAAGAADKS